jgi:DNA-binding NarL/FixJ family response regulator
VHLRLEEHAPDLMIINGRMPPDSWLSPSSEGDAPVPAEAGPRAIAEIRRLEGQCELARVPIVIASSSEALRAAGLAAGADAELDLPATGAALEAVVRGLLGEPPSSLLESWENDQRRRSRERCL